MSISQGVERSRGREVGRGRRADAVPLPATPKSELPLVS